jgi:hypothetical protein
MSVRIVVFLFWALTRLQILTVSANKRYTLLEPFPTTS